MKHQLTFKAGQRNKFSENRLYLIMRSLNRIKGDQGEEIACGYLVDNGYQILDQNFWRPFGEIDIITKFRGRTLVFIEVKTIHKPGQMAMSQPGQNAAKHNQDKLKFQNSIQPEDNLTAKKMAKLKKTCAWYVGQHPELVDLETGWRIDLISLTITGESCLIRHYQNI
ncbi:MAG: YraN family protein [Patescibacteria group bacterium]|nr:YraN family protein [Patescibacteria group bacterium]MCL5262179.1 YraN family protein [Patescibacteria group bacterium]